MKKRVIAILIVSMLLLAACGTAQAASQAGAPASTQAALQPQSPAGTQPPGGLSITQLAVGTIKLDGTDQALTAAEATQLVPLWQALGTIESNAFPQRGQQQQGNATPPDFSAVQGQIQAQVQQIQAAMTTDQLQAIQNMQLTPQDIQTTLQQEGISMGGFQRGNGNGTFQPPQRTPSANGTPGPRGRGGFSGGGTPRAGFGQRGVDFVPPDLINGLVQYLQKIAGS